MAEQYRHSDIVLNPVRADNAPNSVLEALASGVPVVSTRVGGVPFLVQHERSAILTDPDSPAALAEGMRTILSDAELRRRLVDEGLALAAACSWPRVRNLWLETYRAALS